MMTRRSLLLASAGGWVTGQLGPAPRSIDGHILGASHARGHLLLGGAPSLLHAGASACDVVIVGAGVSGLSAAWRLAPAGLDVRVLELESFTGGTSTSSNDGVVPHPWGAHYLPAPNPEARATLRLLSEMNVVTGWDPMGLPRFDPRVLCHEPDERLFYDGKWHHGLVPDDALDAASRAELTRLSETFAAYTERRGSDGRYFFQSPLAESSRDPEAIALDRMSMHDWLDREGYVSDFARWYVRYATLDDFGAELSDVSAWAGIHYFCARKLKTPELAGGHFLVWPEGNGRLVHALEARAHATITNDSLALAVRPTRAGVEIDYLDVAEGTQRTLRARCAVLAIPGFVATRLLPDAGIITRKSSPWLVANLHVTRALDADHAWDSVLHGGAGLGYVDASHQLSPPRTETVLTYFRAYGDADVAATRRSLIAKRWDELLGEVFDDLRPAHSDLAERTHRADLVVWGHAMPRPTPGFLGEAPFLERALVHERVGFGHVDVPGMALFEEAQRAGIRAAEAAALSAGMDLGETWV